MRREDAGLLEKPIHRTRRENLQKVIDELFKGNVSDAARKIAKSHTFMWQLARGKRTIGERSARNIERALRLGENTLDLKIERTKELTAFTSNNANSKQIFRMVPKLKLDDLEAKSETFHFMPIERASAEQVFCADFDSDAMEPYILAGDLIFIDRSETKVQREAMYLLRPKGTRKTRVMRVSKLSGDGPLFATTNKEMPTKKLEGKDVEVVGRVILIIRNCYT